MKKEVVTEMMQQWEWQQPWKEKGENEGKTGAKKLISNILKLQNILFQ